MSQPGKRPAEIANIAAVFLRLSLTGFGGPNAHLALMEHELVGRRRWLSHEQFLRIVALTNLLPGPNSSEVAIHLGIVRGGPIGGLVAGLCFITPTVTAMTALAALYFSGFRDLPLDRPLRGIAPVVVALIAVAGGRLSRASVKRPSDVPLALLGLCVVAWRPRWELAAMALGALIGLARERQSASALMIVPAWKLALASVALPVRVFMTSTPELPLAPYADVLFPFNSSTFLTLPGAISSSFRSLVLILPSTTSSIGYLLPLR